MLDQAELDFVDICTRPYSHAPLTKLAAERGLPVLCQKPFCENLEDAQELVEFCDRAGVRLMINENFRWQTPIRQFRKLLESGELGRIFRARVQFANSFPVFDNQPFLKELDQFDLMRG